MWGAWRCGVLMDEFGYIKYKYICVCYFFPSKHTHRVMSGMLRVKWQAMSAPGGEKRRRVLDLDTKGAHLC